MLLHANPVNVAESLPHAQDSQVSASAEPSHAWAGGMHGLRPPPTFKTTSKAATPPDPGLPVPAGSQRTRLAPLPQQPPQPATSTSQPAASSSQTGPSTDTHAFGIGYQASHHAFIPKTRKRAGPHRNARTVSSASPSHSHSPSSTAAAMAVVQKANALGYGLADDSGVSAVGALDWGFGAGRPGTWGGASSVGDLEALDAILDQLVVLDVRMRQALLRGPLVSFETVVSESAATRAVTEFAGTSADHTDRTFLTSVKGLVSDDDAYHGESVAAPGSPQGVANSRQASQAGAAGKQAELEPQVALQHVNRRQVQQRSQAGVLQEEALDALQQAAGVTDPDAAQFQGAVPVPILPKLARMYISSKQTAAVKSAPLPPPTAAWLLKSRLPMPGLQAPSYDTLVSQIKDVQRQYTCGTARDKATLAAEAARAPAPAPRTNLDGYISGIDGPPLEEVLAPQLGPSLAERSRPTFVALKRTTQSARHHSPAKERMSMIIPGATDSQEAPRSAGTSRTGSRDVSPHRTAAPLTSTYTDAMPTDSTLQRQPPPTPPPLQQQQQVNLLEDSEAATLGTGDTSVPEPVPETQQALYVNNSVSEEQQAGSTAPQDASTLLLGAPTEAEAAAPLVEVTSEAQVAAQELSDTVESGTLSDPLQPGA